MGLVMTLLQQNPHACKSPGAVAQPGREGRQRQHFLLKRQWGRELSPLNGNRRLPSTQSSSRPLPGGLSQQGNIKNSGGIIPLLPERQRVPRDRLPPTKPPIT